MAPRAPWQTRSIDGSTATGGEGLVSHPEKPRHSPMRVHMAATFSEFMGTFLFLFFALGGTHAVNTAPGVTDSASQLMYISLIFGLSLGVNVWAFFRIEGGMFNPAVAIAMFATGGIGFVRLILIVLAQLVASVAAAGLVVGLLPGNKIAAATVLTPGISTVRGFFLEMILTAELVFVIFMLAIQKHRATAVAPIGIGLALFIAELVGVYYTGGSLNPARSFGPACINGFPHYHWIYWIAPILGALLAAGFYKLVKMMEFDLITPDIDEPPSAKQYEGHHNATNGSEV